MRISICMVCQQSYAVMLYLCTSFYRFLGKYIQILVLIIRRDLVPFVCVLIILLFIFAGGFYFALREEVIAPTLVTPECNFSSVEGALSTFNLTVAEVEAAINTSTIPFMTSLDINAAETRYRITEFWLLSVVIVRSNCVYIIKIGWTLQTSKLLKMYIILGSLILL